MLCETVLKTTNGCFDVGFMLESAFLIQKFHLSLVFNVPAQFWLTLYYRVAKSIFLRFVVQFGL
jgi:hypothetical protein